MQNYEVKGVFIVFGIGTLLKLSPEQAEARSLSLEKQKEDGVYIVLDQVQFKQGEKVVIVSEEISKALLENLQEIPDKNPNKNSDKTIGKNTENKKPIKKEEAEKIVLEAQKNQTTEIDNKSPDNSAKENNLKEEAKSQNQSTPNV